MNSSRAAYTANNYCSLHDNIFSIKRPIIILFLYTTNIRPADGQQSSFTRHETSPTRQATVSSTAKNRSLITLPTIVLTWLTIVLTRLTIVLTPLTIALLFQQSSLHGQQSSLHFQQSSLHGQQSSLHGQQSSFTLPTIG